MTRLSARVRALLGLIWSAHTTPARLAAAVLVGAIIGTTPLFGLHLVLCVAAAWLLRLNQVAVYAAANVSVPPLVPLLGFASVQLGERLLHGRWLALRRADFTWSRAPELAARFFGDWLAGGVVLGAALGLIGGACVYAIAARRRTRTSGRDAGAGDPIERALSAASARYRGAHPRFRWYARFKYRMDPCYPAIAALVGESELALDLGTGLGMLPVLLGLLGRRALGIEWDGAKLGAGKLAAAGLPGVELLEGDVRTAPLPPCDVVTLVDVLHYYDPAAQRALLARARAALRPGGRMIVREGDRARAGGARFTRFLEWLVTRAGWNRGPQVCFRSARELQADLEALGLRVETTDAAGRLHPGNVLLVGLRS